MQSHYSSVPKLIDIFLWHNKNSCHGCVKCWYFYVWNFFPKRHKLWPIIYQNKTKMPGKNRKHVVFCNKLQVTSTICKLFEYNFWWRYLELSDKISLTFRIMKNIVMQFVWKLDSFFTSLTILGLESKASICSIAKKIHFCVVNFPHLLLLS